MPSLSLVFVGDNTNASPWPAPKNPAERLRYLIEARQWAKREYAKHYRAIVEGVTAFENLIDVGEPGFEQARSKLVTDSKAIRDNTARFYTQFITRLEFAANELAPGTFDLRRRPLQSEDLDGEKARDILTNVGDLAGAIAVGAAVCGAEPVAAFAAGVAIGIYGGVAVGDVLGVW